MPTRRSPKTQVCLISSSKTPARYFLDSCRLAGGETMSSEVTCRLSKSEVCCNDCRHSWSRPATPSTKGMGNVGVALLLEYCSVPGGLTRTSTVLDLHLVGPSAEPEPEGEVPEAERTL